CEDHNGLEPSTSNYQTNRTRSRNCMCKSVLNCARGRAQFSLASGQIGAGKFKMPVKSIIVRCDLLLNAVDRNHRVCLPDASLWYGDCPSQRVLVRRASRCRPHARLAFAATQSVSAVLQIGYDPRPVTGTTGTGVCRKAARSTGA